MITPHLYFVQGQNQLDIKLRKTCRLQIFLQENMFLGDKR